MKFTLKKDTHPKGDNGSTEPVKTDKPKFTLTKKHKIIAACASAILVLAGVGGGFAYHTYSVQQDCKVQVKLFNQQASDLTESIEEAQQVRKPLDVNGDQEPELAHTKGYAESDEGKKFLADTDKALDEAQKHESDTLPKTCGNSQLKTIKELTNKRATAITELKSATETLNQDVTRYRLAQATEEATTLMEKAKTDLANAQTHASEQMTVVNDEPKMQTDDALMGVYNEVKQIEAESHTISTTITTETYEEAVGSIEKAKTASEKAAALEEANGRLQGAITAYNEAQEAKKQAQQASQQAAAPAQRGGGSARPASVLTEAVPAAALAPVAPLRHPAAGAAIARFSFPVKATARVKDALLLKTPGSVTAQARSTRRPASPSRTGFRNHTTTPPSAHHSRGRGCPSFTPNAKENRHA